jgi:2-polyprenyl-3-methyl-5-hydroxy-6-metoxy-1,4-benzoquinol methylase
MLARATQSKEFEEWNRKWGSPYGKFRVLKALNRLPLLKQSSHLRRAIGPFGFQFNTSTRAFEYPWTYFQLVHEKRSTILEIGGALSGLQFVLSMEGHEVHNVDPFFDYGLGEYGIDPLIEHEQLNRLFGANVVLHKTTLPEVKLDRRFDAVICVSTIEHMSASDIAATLQSAKELLVPGGLLVLTVDLFLDVVPFTTSPTNKWGTTVSIAWMQEVLGFEMVAGTRAELYGYDEFSSEEILRNVKDFATNLHYPQLAQMVAFQSSIT